MRSVGRRPGRPRIDPALKKKQPAPYLAADIKTRREPQTSEVMEKLKFFKWVKLTSPSDESEYYRVIAYAHQPMREAAWKKLFQAFSVKKIDGYFEGYGPYLKIRDRKDQGPNCNWVGVPPACLRRTPEATELSELEGSDFSSESEDPINAASDAVKPESEDHFYDINYRNMIKVALRYREHHGIKSTELADVLAQMCQNGWAFCLPIHKQGIPDTYFTEFTAQCEGKSSFTREMISRMRRPVRKRARLALAAEADEAVGEASQLEQAETSDAASPSGLEALEAATAATAAKAASADLAARATLAVRAAWGKA